MSGSIDTALPEAQSLKAALLLHGVPEVSIELQEGRPSPYADDWNCQFVVTDTSHHTVSNYKPTNLTPCLSLIKKGRGMPGTSGYLPGPLANGYGGWDLCFRIITLGYANHPGEGGPLTVAGGYTIPQDSGRRYMFGVEYEGGITESDWDRELTNPRTGAVMTFREFMGRCNAGIQDQYNLPDLAHTEHSTWAPGRKVDRLHYSQADGVAEIRRWRESLPASTDTRPRNVYGQLSMSYNAILTSLEQEVSHTYLAWRDSAILSLKYLGWFDRAWPNNQHSFRQAWYTMVDDINASANRYAFDWFVDRCGFWPPNYTTNDWPENAWKDGKRT